MVVSISTAFHPNAIPAPDMMFSSSDGVIFYVNRTTIQRACPTAFASSSTVLLHDLALEDTILPLDIGSAELNIILHALYSNSPVAQSPNINTLVRAVDLMPTFDIPPKMMIVPLSPLHDLLLSQAPLYGLEIYALGSHHEIHSLAVGASSHLLSCDLATISDEKAVRIGPLYLKRLMLLHINRFTALKAILLRPPHPHPPTKKCTLRDQERMTRTWAMVAASFSWDARPDVTTQSIQAALEPPMKQIDCEVCQQTLKAQVKDVIVQWASVKSSFAREERIFSSYMFTPAMGDPPFFITLTPIICSANHLSLCRSMLLDRRPMGMFACALLRSTQ
ncbi:hypothetical protein CPC08DRAFT_530762 [Agrocybe pediades]|nr:hypothetical protein CPC08DRAFT_530762 [Agrocybe pediades]